MTRQPRMAVTFSDDWFSGIEEVSAAARSEREGPTFSLEFCCSNGEDSFVHHQVWESGNLVAWAPGPLTGRTDLCLVQPLLVNLAMLRRAGGTDSLAGNALASETTVRNTVSGEETPVPIYDEVVIDWARDIPEIPTAGPLTVQQITTDSPFGTLSVVWDIDRGTFTSVRADGGRVVPQPDAMVRRTYTNYLMARTGHLDVLESLHGGDVAGDVVALTYLLGVTDSEEVSEARRALGPPSWRALASLGEILNGDLWTTTYAPLFCNARKG